VTDGPAIKRCGLSQADRERLVISLLSEEIGRMRGKAVAVSTTVSWTAATTLEDDLGLDSLARLDVAGRINQFFHLHEVGIEDYLLMEATIGGWTRIVEKSLEQSFQRITFQTSGSTGTPKACTHGLDTLLAEVDALADMFQEVSQIVAFVPPHHIYGFIFTILLPSRLQVPVRDARALSPGALRAGAGPGELWIATPHLWTYLAASLPSFPQAVRGVTSTAPMPDDLARRLAGQGLTELTEVYGSSETAGIGWRREPGGFFALFPHWTKGAAGDALLRRGDAQPVPLMDGVEWHDDRHLRPTGRRDGAVQIGGVNVFPDRVAEILAGHDDVMTCYVRTFAMNGDEARRRLKAFIVPARPDADLAALEQALMQRATELLTPLERPVSFTFGAEPPRNAMGKLADW
jgi:4-coumarate--CoA ligase (photoactive yellow protein activation family)